jgi:hypothetical protein
MNSVNNTRLRRDAGRCTVNNISYWEGKDQHDISQIFLTAPFKECGSGKSCSQLRDRIDI